ncbi:MAG: hypothetical protein HYW22_02100 [Candidatus Aenigmarchaeota archaeon]|nr:hypothetical protein [Candidatus Aenigmarchaeota archaeon]
MSNVLSPLNDLILDKDPGLGLNANPFESEIYLDLTGPLGSLTAQYYSLMFQLRKNGFEVFKMDEQIDVSPSFKQYYDLTLQQNAALEAQLKAGLGQVANAIHDYELIAHDLRKYKEYLDYFVKMEEGEHLMKSKKKGDMEKGEPMKKEGAQLLKSVFIDQVDAHTGEGIALRTITQRWPTIIVDFMRLDDKDIDQKDIAKKYQFTEAEGSILATKNKIFLEWRDNLFKPTLQERYQNILRLTESRRNSIQRYTEMLKPIAARYKLITDSLEGSPGRAFATGGFFQPSSQAYSIDQTRIWAFLPFEPAEKYKYTREFVNEIPISQTGFKKDHIEELIKMGKIKKKDEKVDSLPIEPSIDEIIWRYFDRVQDYYKVKLTIGDIFEARKRLVDYFKMHMPEVYGGSLKPGGTTSGNTWILSPYFVFLDIPFIRAVLRMPNGDELENLMLSNMTVQNRSQNVIIVNLLEVIAREKQLENYINQLLGEVGVSNPEEVRKGKIPEFDTIENMAKKQYPRIFKTKEELEKEEKKKMEKLKDQRPPVTKAKNVIGDFLNLFGIKLGFFRGRGPYEIAMDDRISEMYQLEAAFQGYLFVLRYLQQGAGVPGVKV